MAITFALASVAIDAVGAWFHDASEGEPNAAADASAGGESQTYLDTQHIPAWPCNPDGVLCPDEWDEMHGEPTATGDTPRREREEGIA